MPKNRYDTAVEQQRKDNRELHETLKTLESLKMDKLDFEEIKRVLKNAIRLLASLKKEWTNLVMFFSSVANIVKVKALSYFQSYFRPVPKKSGFIQCSSLMIPKHQVLEL